MPILSLMVMAGTAIDKYKDLIRGCCQTWVIDFNVVYFFGGDESGSDIAFEKEMITITNGKARFIHLPGVREDYISASHKQWQGLVYMMKNDPADWYGILGTDNYINCAAIHGMLQKHGTRGGPCIVGGVVQERKVGINFPFALGGGGLFINAAGAAKLFNGCPYADLEERANQMCESWFDECVKFRATDLIAACDVALCYYTWKADIPIIGERGLYPIDCYGAQYFQGVTFYHTPDNITVCHYMDRGKMLNYRFDTTVDKKRIAAIIVENNYTRVSSVPSDIFQHIPRLAELAKECSVVAECGVRAIVSTWGFIKGLAESKESGAHHLYCVDNNFTNDTKRDFDRPMKIAQALGVKIDFFESDSAKVVFPTTVDLLFIDTWHVYAHLKRELAHHHKNVAKFIVMHDTEIDAIHGESIREYMNVEQQSRDSGYPVEEITKGLRPAIEEFAYEHRDEWVIAEHYGNNNGLTIMKRIAYAGAPVAY